MARIRIRRPLLALIVLLAALVVGYAIRAASSDDGGASKSPSATSSNAVSTGSTVTAGGEVPLSSLPAQAATTVKLIQSGGPFPYPRNDGVVFHNNEHHLPARSDGYYHEYTVPTPGASNRGARRIITGKDGEFYYTADHYEHFVQVDINS